MLLILDKWYKPTSIDLSGVSGSTSICNRKRDGFYRVMKRKKNFLGYALLPKTLCFVEVNNT